MISAEREIYLNNLENMNEERLAELQERERIERTEAQLRAIRGLDRRTGSLLQELAKEVDILADYFWDSRNELNNNYRDNE
jgi:hypothetical protein